MVNKWKRPVRRPLSRGLFYIIKPRGESRESSQSRVRQVTVSVLIPPVMTSVPLDLAEAPELFGMFLQGCFCAVDSLMSINYLKICNFVKYIL